MTSIGSPSPFFFGGKKAYAVDRSLRFNDDDDTYLQRTVSSTSNRKTFTISAWIKPSETDSRFFFGVTDTSGYEFFYIGINSFYRLVITDYDYPVQNVGLVTNRLFRDPSAWYHIVVAFDTTQATNTDRVKLYVNGVQEASWYNTAYPAQNLDTFVNHTTFPIYIGKLGWGGGKYHGYMAEYNFIDGLQLTPSSFGETDAITGQWNPKKYIGSYGTNGFYLNFSDNSGTTATTLGKDSSGNGNNFTPNNFSVAAGAGNDSLEDTPTNNFCTLNPITFGSGGGEPSATLSNGNLDFTESSSNNRTAVSTFGLKTGKWYFEFLSTNTGTFSIGWHDFENNQGSFYRNNGSYSSSFGGGGTFGYSSWTTNDIVGVAIDFDSGKIWYAKNNTWQSGDPATGNSPTNTFTTGRTLHTEAFTDNSSGTKSGSFNYGQRAFTYTPPTGYKSICSANLPDPTILLPNKHFDTVLYTGSGSGTQSITSLNFQPDWVWLKVRSTGGWHALVDSVRGVGKILASNEKDAENNSSDSQTAFSAFLNNGFTVGYNSSWYVNGTPSGSSTQVAWNWNAGDTDGVTYRVVVVSDSGNKYRFRNSANTATFAQSAVTLDLAEGGTYIFDGSDSTMDSHPIVLAENSNGSPMYETGVTYELDGSAVANAAAYASGYASATTRRLIFTVPSSAPNLYYVCYNHLGMGGAINTNTTLGSSNFDGSTQSTVKANTTAGFSIVKYTGQQNATDTIGHGLGIQPQVVITKSRNSTYTYTQWYVYHHKLSTNHFLFLNETNAQGDGLGDYYVDASFSSTVFAVGDDIYGPNVSSNNYIAYCFSEVEGYSKFGNYIPNQNDNGPFVYTGFRPRWILLKSRGNIYGGGSPFSGNWYILDTERSTFNVAASTLATSNSNAEDNGWGTEGIMDILSNGFKIRTDSLGINATLSGSFIYLAFAESPFKNARAR